MKGRSFSLSMMMMMIERIHLAWMAAWDGHQIEGEEVRGGWSMCSSGDFQEVY